MTGMASGKAPVGVGKAVNVYDSADKALKAMNRYDLKQFDRLRLMKADDINLIKAVSDVYDKAAAYARDKFYEVAVEAYIIGAIQARMTNAEATRRVDKVITRDWVDEMLEEVDFVTLYRFNTEVERKKQRLTEALTVADSQNDEVDKAVRAWTLQIGQYAINVTDMARMEAFMDAGIERVKWVTEKDQRVCAACHELDGQIFSIEDAPSKQHYNCRCVLVPVFGK